MSQGKERILLVESDPDIIDLVARQALRPLGYQVKVVTDTPQAIQEAAHFAPDVMLVNIHLPGLSGKDLLVALSSQGMDVPTIVLAEDGGEAEVIQAFRLGAVDYLATPLREAEVVSAVERALKQVRARRERERLARKLEQTNKELKRRVRELTTLVGIGKLVTSITDQRTLFARIVERAVAVAEADMGWLHLRKGNTKRFILSAQKNLPKTIAAKLNATWDDGISTLVALSGEPLAIHGQALQKFKVARLGKAALVVPVKAQDQVIGLLVVVRREARPFDTSSQTLLTAVADYASISLINANLFKALEQRARSLEAAADVSHAGEQFKGEILNNLYERLKPSIEGMARAVDALAGHGDGGEDPLHELRRHLHSMQQVLDGLEKLVRVGDSPQLGRLDLVELVQTVVAEHRADAAARGVSLKVELPEDPIPVRANAVQLETAVDALLSNALRYAGRRGEVRVQVTRPEAAWAQVTVQDSGPGLTAVQRKRAFLPFYQDGDKSQTHPGIGLTLAKEIVQLHGGKIWVDSHSTNGAVLHFRIPALDGQTA